MQRRCRPNAATLRKRMSTLMPEHVPVHMPIHTYVRMPHANIHESALVHIYDTLHGTHNVHGQCTCMHNCTRAGTRAGLVCALEWVLAPAIVGRLGRQAGHFGYIRVGVSKDRGRGGGGVLGL